MRGEPDAIYVATASGGLFEEREQRHLVVAGLRRRRRDDVHRRGGRGAVVAEHGLGRHRRSEHSAELELGRRRLQEHRRRKDVDDMGLKDTRSVGRIVIDPTTPNVVYVAAQGHLWGPNAERGVFKTTDGGQTWKKVLFVDENTGANDIVIDPANPLVLYAATYQRQRRTWGFNGGGPGSGIQKTIDGGATWTKLTNGLPGRQGPHRAVALRRRSAGRLRHRRSPRTRHGIYRRRRRRRDLAEDVLAQHAAQLLLADPH